MDPIKHVVVLMFENHSFDQMLGCFQSVYAELDGVDPQHPRSNQDSSGRTYVQRQSDDTIVDPDPKHELENTLSAIGDGNSGFVAQYETVPQTTTPDQRQRIMDYFGRGDLPALHELATGFTICDHWYSSVPGPTWTNRFFVHSGTSMGLVTMPSGIFSLKDYLSYTQDTIYDRLNEKAVSWKIYYGDVPQSLVLSKLRTLQNAKNFHQMQQFYQDAEGQESDFPQYTFIEPNYFHLPFEQQPQNDDHPPHSTMEAQKLLANVYNAIRANGDLWNSTLLVVLYDENGGFYDHVSPPPAVPPDDHHDEYTFDRFGVRVPALLVSPWVDAGFISTEFDHTSVLKYLADKWGLTPLTERDSQANSFASAIRLAGQPRTDTPLSINMATVESMMPAPAPQAAEAALPMNENQKALVHFTEHLETETVVPPAATPPKKLAATAAAPTGGHLAKRRVEAFLAKQKAAAAAGNR